MKSDYGGDPDGQQAITADGVGKVASPQHPTGQTDGKLHDIEVRHLLDDLVTSMPWPSAMMVSKSVGQKKVRFYIGHVH